MRSFLPTLAQHAYYACQNGRDIDTSVPRDRLYVSSFTEHLHLSSRFGLASAGLANLALPSCPILRFILAGLEPSSRFRPTLSSWSTHGWLSRHFCYSTTIPATTMEEKQACTSILVISSRWWIDLTRLLMSSTFRHLIRSLLCVYVQIALCLCVLNVASQTRGSPFVYGADGRQPRRQNNSRQTYLGHAG